MSITYIGSVGGSSGSSSERVSVNISAISGYATGDVALLFITSNNTVTSGTPVRTSPTNQRSPWVPVGHCSPTVPLDIGVWMQIVVDNNQVFSMNIPADCGYMFAIYRGVDLTTPVITNANISDACTGYSVRNNTLTVGLLNGSATTTESGTTTRRTTTFNSSSGSANLSLLDKTYATGSVLTRLIKPVSGSYYNQVFLNSASDALNAPTTSINLSWAGKATTTTSGNVTVTARYTNTAYPTLYYIASIAGATAANVPTPPSTSWLYRGYYNGLHVFTFASTSPAVPSLTFGCTVASGGPSQLISVSGFSGVDLDEPLTDLCFENKNNGSSPYGGANGTYYSYLRTGLRPNAVEYLLYYGTSNDTSPPSNGSYFYNIQNYVVSSDNYYLTDAYSNTIDDGTGTFGNTVPAIWISSPIGQFHAVMQPTGTSRILNQPKPFAVAVTRMVGPSTTQTNNTAIFSVYDIGPSKAVFNVKPGDLEILNILPGTRDDFLSPPGWTPLYQGSSGTNNTVAKVRGYFRISQDWHSQVTIPFLPQKSLLSLIVVKGHDPYVPIRPASSSLLSILENNDPRAPIRLTSRVGYSTNSQNNTSPGQITTGVVYPVRDNSLELVFVGDTSSLLATAYGPTSLSYYDLLNVNGTTNPSTPPSALVSAYNANLDGTVKLVSKYQSVVGLWNYVDTNGSIGMLVISPPSSAPASPTVYAPTGKRDLKKLFGDISESTLVVTSPVDVDRLLYSSFFMSVLINTTPNSPIASGYFVPGSGTLSSTPVFFPIDQSYYDATTNTIKIDISSVRLGNGPYTFNVTYANSYGYSPLGGFPIDFGPAYGVEPAQNDPVLSYPPSTMKSLLIKRLNTFNWTVVDPNA